MKSVMKKTACLCALLLTVSAVPAIGVNAAKTPAQSFATAQADRTMPNFENVKFGKVTAVNGSQITLAVFERSAMKDTSEKAENNSVTSAEKPFFRFKGSTDSGTNTESGWRRRFAGKRGNCGFCNDTGESLTVTVNEAVTVQKNGETVTVSDIAENDFVVLVYDDNGTLTNVKIAPRQGERNARFGANVQRGKGTET